jgi:feruloyl esterase
MMTEFNLGYAIAGTDGGHSLAATGNTLFAPFLENLGEIDAWLHNAVAMTTPPVRSLATEYYNESPAYSYYYGCSTGGGQGYALAEIYPDLFDGIYAGSPGNWYSHLILSFLYNYLQTNGSGYMSQDALNFITAKVIEECDLLDGVKDNLVENPLACHFNVQTLACSHDESATSANGTVLCLTSAQVEAAEKIYAGPKNTLTGEQIYPGFNVGGELGWIDQETILYSEYTSLILKELVFKNLEYNVDTFNFGSDVCNVDEVASPLLDAISPNLSAFKSRGGKLITTQGWADPYNAPTWPIEFLEMINSATAGRNAAEFMQIYMVPGGGHCGPNTGYPAVPGTYDVLGALVPWVEQGIVPTQMLSTGSLDGLNTTRKLCPYPKNAKYISGSIDDWASYTCA